MTETREPSKVSDVRKETLHVVVDPDPTVSESEQEPASFTHSVNVSERKLQALACVSPPRDRLQGIASARNR